MNAQIEVNNTSTCFNSWRLARANIFRHTLEKRSITAFGSCHQMGMINLVKKHIYKKSPLIIILCLYICKKNPPHIRTKSIKDLFSSKPAFALIKILPRKTAEQTRHWRQQRISIRGRRSSFEIHNWDMKGTAEQLPPYLAFVCIYSLHGCNIWWRHKVYTTARWSLKRHSFKINIQNWSDRPRFN